MIAEPSFDECWEVADDSTLQTAVFYERVAATSCDACIERCKATWARSSGRLCHSLVFDFKVNICDLFDVNDVGGTFRTAAYPGRGFFTPVKSSKCPGPPCATGQLRSSSSCVASSREPRAARTQELGLKKTMKPTPYATPAMAQYGESPRRVILNPRCWRTWTNTGVSNGVPFARYTSITYQDCAYQCRLVEVPTLTPYLNSQHLLSSLFSDAIRSAAEASLTTITGQVVICTPWTPP